MHTIILMWVLILISFSSFSGAIYSENTTIAHPETGLFLDYLGPYIPAQGVIHNLAIFPMTAATCHLLPLSAAEKIPACNFTMKRTKRILPVLISLGAGIVNLGMSLANTIQTAFLKKETASVKKPLADVIETMQIQGAYLARIQAGQLVLAEQLEMTQGALNSTLPVLQSHS